MPASDIILICTLLLLLGVGALVWYYRSTTRRLEREHFIRGYVFQATLFASFRQKYPQLEDKDVYLVARALREFFIIYLRANNTMIGMPSRVVDDLWHEFILATRTYQEFCQKAFGHFLHHLPATEASHDPRANAGMAFTWRLACLEENINPRKPTRLPLLFAIDEKLKIEKGMHYSLTALIAWARPKRDTGSNACGGTSSCSSDGGSSGGHSGHGCSAGNCGGGGCGGGCGGD